MKKYLDVKRKVFIKLFYTKIVENKGVLVYTEIVYRKGTFFIYINSKFKVFLCQE